MSWNEPVWALTDEALALTVHAEHDILREQEAHPNTNADRAGGLAGSGAAGGSTRLRASMRGVQWTRETAVVRLVSAVESYTDEVSNLWLTKKSLPMPAKAPATWKDRCKEYVATQSIDLTACSAWDKVQAGVELRNSVAHGLGALTRVQQSDEDITAMMAQIDVDVHSGRMHPRPTTVPVLARACRDYILDLETRLVATL